MDVDARSAGARRGERLLLRDLRRLEALEARDSARERVEDVLGPELTARLVPALAPHRPSRAGAAA